jgi:hypothetical protein
MIVSTEDMKSCIQEWFAQVYSFEDLAEVFYTVKSEADKQFVYMAENIAMASSAAQKN